MRSHREARAAQRSKSQRPKRHEGWRRGTKKEISVSSFFSFSLPLREYDFVFHVRDSGEHELVDGEDNRRDARRCYARLAEDPLHAKMFWFTEMEGN